MNETFEMTTTVYGRTDSGKSWKSKPDKITTEKVTKKQWERITHPNNCSFFRRLGGSETLTRCYTSQGFIPVQLVSTSPDRQVKKVRSIEVN